MKNKQHVQQQVEDTFNMLNTIKKVEVNHFFKHKVMQKIKEQKQEEKSIFSWFTPQLQLASLSVLLLLNVATIFYAFSNSEASSSSSIEEFAQEYALQSNSNSILN